MATAVMTPKSLREFAHGASHGTHVIATIMGDPKPGSTIIRQGLRVSQLGVDELRRGQSLYDQAADRFIRAAAGHRTAREGVELLAEANSIMRRAISGNNTLVRTAPNVMLDDLDLISGPRRDKKLAAAISRNYAGMMGMLAHDKEVAGAATHLPDVVTVVPGPRRPPLLVQLGNGASVDVNAPQVMDMRPTHARPALTGSDGRPVMQQLGDPAHTEIVSNSWRSA